MKVIGVTGGVGAGKSEVLGYIAERLGNIAVMPFKREIPENFMKELEQFFSRF